MDIHAKCSFCGKPVVRRKQAASRNVRRHFCDQKCKAEFQKLAKPVTKEWLEEQYVKKGLDCTQIGRIVKRDPHSVWNWLKDFGIPTRPRGGFTSTNCWKKGQRLWLGRKHSRSTKQKIREARIRDGHVPYLKNGTHWLKHEGNHPGNWKGGITPGRQALYGSDKWKEIAKEVRKRDRWTCQHCGRKQSDDRNISFDLHHIVGFECVELRTESTNLVLLCEPCHYWVHSKKNVARLFIKDAPE